MALRIGRSLIERENIAMGYVYLAMCFLSKNTEVFLMYLSLSSFS